MISLPPRPSLLHRLFAVAALLLVIALTVLVASPDLHSRLHAGDSDHATHEAGCAVTLFSQGVEPLLALALLLAPLVRVIVAPPSAHELFLVRPRFLRLPERGPPGC